MKGSFKFSHLTFTSNLGEAAVGLEKKQKEKYGGTAEYEAWCKTSWAGPQFDPKGGM